MTAQEDVFAIMGSTLQKVLVQGRKPGRFLLGPDMMRVLHAAVENMPVVMTLGAVIYPVNGIGIWNGVVYAPMKLPGVALETLPA